MRTRTSRPTRVEDPTGHHNQHDGLAILANMIAMASFAFAMMFVGIFLFRAIVLGLEVSHHPFDRYGVLGWWTAVALMWLSAIGGVTFNHLTSHPWLDSWPIKGVVALSVFSTIGLLFNP